MKRKSIVLAATAVMLMASLVVGGTLAYFTDDDQATNVFTTGDVEIDLTENFTQESKLVPATGSAQAGTLQNGVTKEVFVTNTGSEDAYVRVHIAIPAILDNAQPDFDASKNVLHFNYDSENVGEGKWDWSNATGTPYEGNWNFYEETIGGIAYNVYVVTYEGILASDATTESAMSQVYLDATTTNDDIETINGILGENWKMYVVAEGAQEAGFADAYEALNTAFGAPGTYDVNWVEAAG